MKFLDNLSFGQYIPAQSIIHRLDPRAKILAIVLLISGIFMADKALDWALWCSVFVILAFFSEIQFSFLLRSVKAVVFLIVFTAVMNLLLMPGKIIWEWGIFSISSEGVEMAWTMSLRLILLIMFANLLTLTTSPMQLADGLESLLSPLKHLGFPAHELAMMMTIALRFIPTLLAEADRILKAQIARGADLDQGSIMKRLKAFLPVLIPLFVIVFQRAEELATAMEARCYRGGEGRTRMKPFRWKTADTMTLVFCTVVIFVQEIIDRSSF